MQIQAQYLPTPEELARAAASDFVKLVAQRADPAAPFGIALSGGRIAPLFYDAIAAEAVPRGVSFERVHFFWADERCVAPDHPESNYAQARTHLFVPLRIAESNIHRIRGENDPAASARESEKEVCAILMKPPIFNLVILGMGEDGHIASLFPAEDPEWVDDAKIYRHVVATKPPPDRITLGYKPIIAARETWILISGRGKTNAFERLLRDDESLPVARVVSRRKGTKIYQDVRK
jgi:6-phosphogluconolactonase